MRHTIIAILFACLAIVHLGACHSSNPTTSGEGGHGGTGGSANGTGGVTGGAVGSGGISSQGGAVASGGSSASTVAVACAVPAEAGPESTTGATVVGDALCRFNQR